MPEIILDAKAKLAWYDQVCFDTELSHAGLRVAVATGSHFNRFSGETFLSRETLARKLNVSTKTVERAVKELESRGHLKVTRPVGRGNANIYRPNIWCESSSGPAGKTATNSDAKRDKTGEKTRQRSLPYPDSLPKDLTHKTKTEPPDQPSAVPPPAPPQTRPDVSAVRPARAFRPADPIERSLCDLLTVPGGDDGFHVLLNLSSRTRAVLEYRCREKLLTPADIESAQAEFRDEAARGRLIELLPAA